MHDTELDELIEDSKSRVQKVLDEYQNTKFWRKAYIDDKRQYWGQYRIHYYPNKDIRIPNNMFMLVFHPIKGAVKTSIPAWYKGGDRLVDEIHAFLKEVADKINRATAIQRFCVKKYIEEHPDLIV